jgi:hypothetical protein
MPCAMWSKGVPTISMPPLCSPKQEWTLIPGDCDIRTERQKREQLRSLHQALKAQDRNSDSWFVEKRFRDAWRGSDGSLKLDDLV